MEEHVSTEAEEEEEEGMEEEYVLTEEEKNGLSEFLKDMPSKLSYLPPQPTDTFFKYFWVFWSHQSLSSDDIRSSTPVPNLVDLLIKEKIKYALQEMFNDDDDDDEVLFQYWAPVTIEGQCFLTTSDQPFALNNIDSSSLQSYRKHSLDYKFRVDDGASEQNLGLPGRVFRTKLPEYTPDVRYYSNTEYPQRYHAVHCNLRMSFAFPVFKSNGQVVGVLESIFTRHNLGVLCDLGDAVCNAFKDVGLECLNRFCSHYLQQLYVERGDFQDTVAEIKEVFKVVCKTHRIPFAQTWVSCKHCSDVAYGDGYVYPNEEILVPVEKGLYTLDDNIFFGTYLRKGLGVPGKAYLSHNSCFCRDVTQLNMFQYPNAHFARHVGLAGSFAISLQSSKTGDQDYVLEFFMPPSESNCEDPIRTLLDPLMVTMKQQFRTFKLSSGKELGDELPVEVLEPNMCEKLGPLKLCQSTISPPRSEPLQSGRDIMEEHVSTESEEEEEEGMEEEYVLTERENCLSEFLKDMPTKLSYLPPQPLKNLWVFWSHQSLSSDAIRSSTPVPNLVDLLIKEKIKSALLNLRGYYYDEVLYQFWAPVTIDGRCFLTTSDQPFALTKIGRSSNLQSYRKHSLDYKFRVDDGASEQNLGLPGRVFCTKLPEYTPDVRYYSNTEYPQRYHAVHCKLRMCFAFPVFKSNGQVVGVLESVFTRYDLVDLCDLGDAVCNAFKKVGLKCFNRFCSHYLQQLYVERGDFQDTVAEIKEVFKVVCKTHRIPFAQTWVSCKHCSDVAYGDGYVYPNEEILIPVEEGLYTLDGNIFVGKYLRKGLGVPGKAYLSHNSCFCRDVTQLNMFQYPHAHFARHFGLAGSFAISLQSSKTGDQDYVLEFFMPPSESNCEDPIRTLLDPLMVTMKQQFRTFKLSSGKELGDELPVEVLEPNMCEKLGPLKLCQSTISPPRSEPLQSGRTIMEADLPYQESMVEIEAINEGRNDNASAEQIDEAVPYFENEVTVVNTTLEKETRNDEIPISYEVISQHMGRTSLEDTAKSLGVSRSTFKRICRKYEIRRWKPPKGKSKKQSLQKTTRHINESVQDSPQTMVLASLAPSSLHPAGGSATWHQTKSFFAFQQCGESRVPKGLHPLAVEASLEDQDHLLVNWSKYVHTSEEGNRMIMEVPWRRTIHKEPYEENVKLAYKKNLEKVEKLLKPQLPTHEIKIPQLTQQEMKIVEYIFDSRESAGEILVRYPLEHATRDAMHSLRPEKWLCDVIINLMVCKLTFKEIRRHPDLKCRSWYLPTYVAQQILGKGAQVSRMAEHYFGPERYSGLLLACEKVFIPVNVRSEHWFLCVINMRQGAVYILDPLPSPPSNKDSEEMVGKIVNFMDKLLAHLHGDEYKRRIVDFPIQRSTVPQQNNLYDCGVYIIKFMECYDVLPRVQFRFDSVHARKKIVVDLVLEEHNKVWDVVLKKVQRHNPRNESM